MSNQLTTRINVEDGTALDSRLKAAGSRILAFAAVFGSQFLAFVAVAQPVEVEKNPIFDPASLGVGFVVGVIVGVVAIKATSKKKKD